MHRYLTALVALLLASCGGGSDVTKINVTVEGLRGALVLQNNGKDDLTIEKDGSYAFEVKATDTEYSIENIQEPCEQRCTVTDASGDIQKGQTLEVKVACVAKEWEFPAASDKINISSNVNLMDAKMDKHGDIVVLWSKLFSSDAQIYISEYRNGQWIKPSALTDRLSFFGYNVLDAKMVMNDDGEVVIIWVQNANSFMNERYIYKAEYRDGVWKKSQSLSDPINSNLNDTSWYPGVVMNSRGDTIITWVMDQQYLFKSEYRNGTWTHPDSTGDAINASGDNGPTNPKAAINSSGETVIAWSQFDNNANKIFKSEYHNGTWTHPSSISDAYSMSEQSGSVADVSINDDNDVNLLLYGSSQAAFIRPAYFMMTRQNNDWTYPASFGDHFSFTNDNNANLGLSLSTDSTGNAFLVWHENFENYRAEFKNGQWNMPSDNGETYHTTSGVSLVNHNGAMDDEGNRLIFWSEDPDLDGIKDIMIIEKRGGDWKDLKTLVNGTESRNPQNGIKGDSNNCRSMIAWEEISGGDSETSDIYVAQYR